MEMKVLKAYGEEEEKRQATGKMLLIVYMLLDSRSHINSISISIT